eukprot:2254961-Amphidinium_carterae.1
MGMIRALYPLVIYGSEVSGLAATSLLNVRVSARRALGRGAQLRRAAAPWTSTPSVHGRELCRWDNPGLRLRHSGRPLM